VVEQSAVEKNFCYGIHNECVPDKRIYADRAEYLKKAVAERRRKLKQVVVEYKGGKCVICGYKRYAGAFDLRHIGR
jgi:hypothetical protein